jgi:phosphoglycolate phosphatase
VGDLHRLIAFDLDGTLIDSRRDLADSANALVVELGGLPLPEDAVARMVGEGASLLVRRALSAAGLEEPEDSVARFLDFYSQRLLNHTRLYPGIAELVREAREHARVVVLTNKPKQPTTQILEGLGLLDLFDEVVGGDGPLPRKPDPAALVALMDSAGADRRTTLMVGDSPIDYLTAVNANVQCCIVAFGFGFANFRPEHALPKEWVAADAPAVAERIRAFASTSSSEAAG